jgi:putative Mg2+ transporter-C (MgtC) family protein
MLDWTDVVFRLTAATLAGAAIGLDRDLRGKPTGVRTMSIVALGAATIVLASQYPGHAGDLAASSRVMQGIITGIGFLGAGVILHNPSGGKVHGLTTAASIWLTACIGAACGTGAWPIVLVSTMLVAIVLGFGKALEQAFERRFPRGEHGSGDGPEAPGA